MLLVEAWSIPNIFHTGFFIITKQEIKIPGVGTNETCGEGMLLKIGLEKK